MNRLSINWRPACLLALGILLSGCINIEQYPNVQPLPTVAQTAAPLDEGSTGVLPETPSSTPQTVGTVDFFQGGVITLSGVDMEPFYIPFSAIYAYERVEDFCIAWGLFTGESPGGKLTASLQLAMLPSQPPVEEGLAATGKLYYPADANPSIALAQTWRESVVVISPSLPGTGFPAAAPSLRQIEGPPVNIEQTVEFAGATSLENTGNNLHNVITDPRPAEAVCGSESGRFPKLSNAELLIYDNRQGKSSYVLVVIQDTTGSPGPNDWGAVNRCAACRYGWWCNWQYCWFR